MSRSNRINIRTYREVKEELNRLAKEKGQKLSTYMIKTCIKESYKYQEYLERGLL